MKSNDPRLEDFTHAFPMSAEALEKAIGEIKPHATELPADLPAPHLPGSCTSVGIWRLEVQGEPRKPHATVGAWLVSGPFHVAWSRWLVSIVHLRPVPGVDAAKLHFETATHEVQIMSCDPEHYGEHAEILASKGARWFRLLDPPDLICQIEVTGDAMAVQCVEPLLRLVADGQLSPDSDFRRSWERMLVAHAAEFRSGKRGSA